MQETIPLHFLCRSSNVPGLFDPFASRVSFFVSRGGGAVIGGGGGIAATLVDGSEAVFEGERVLLEAATTFPILDQTMWGKAVMQPHWFISRPVFLPSTQGGPGL